METKNNNLINRLVITMFFTISFLICGAQVEKTSNDNGNLEVIRKKLKESKNVKVDCEKIIVEYIKENEKLKTENKFLRESTNKLSQGLEDLKKKVEVAKVLKIYDMEVVGYKVTKKESKPTIKAKEINRISVLFNIAENTLSDPGNKEVYMVVYDSRGLLQTVQKNKFENKIKQKDQEYSASKKIEYDNSKMKVSIDFDFTHRLTKGKYNIELYTDGFYSGKTEFSLQ